MELKCLVPSLSESLGQIDLKFIHRFVCKDKTKFLGRLKKGIKRRGNG